MIIAADSKILYATNAFREFGEVRVVPTNAMTRHEVADADVILIRSETRIDEEFIAGTKIRFVGTATIGTDHVDLAALQRYGIGFASCPGSNANSVAEYVLASLLELAHRQGGALSTWTLGIIGHGNTGSRTAQKAAALGMNVLLNDPPLERATADPRYLPMDALMSADVISLHVPLTTAGPDATFHLFDEARLCSMKRGAILINTSRGSVVDGKSLKQLLYKGHFAGCVLDVWEGEPDIDPELLDLVTLGTPHIAGYSHDGKLNATRMLQDALSRHFNIPYTQHTLEEAEIRELRVTPAESAQAVVREAVKQAYDIEKDDAHLRLLTSLPASQRHDYFRQLRAGYPTRREFHNFRIPGKGLPDDLMMMLMNIGFLLSPA